MEVQKEQLMHLLLDILRKVTIVLIQRAMIISEQEYKILF